MHVGSSESKSQTPPYLQLFSLHWDSAGEKIKSENEIMTRKKEKEYMFFYLLRLRICRPQTLK